MSLDGAVIPSSESAIRELSLDGMADAIAEVDAGGPSESRSSASPILPRKAPSAVSPSPAHLAAFGRRDTSATITADDNEDEALKGANAIAESETQMPGALSDEVTVDEGAKGEAHTGRQDGPGASPATRRVSFFSYADIINETPAEVVDFEHSIQQTAAAEPHGTVRGHTPKHSSTGAGMPWLAASPSPKASRPVSVFGTARAGTDGAGESPLLMGSQLAGSARVGRASTAGSTSGGPK